MSAVWCIVIEYNCNYLICYLAPLLERLLQPTAGTSQYPSHVCRERISSYPFTVIINDDMLFSKFTYILVSETIGYVNGDEVRSTTTWPT